MEAVGLLLGSAQGIAQLAGVIKRHVSCHRTLFTRASSIESKAKEASRVSERISGLIELSALPHDLLAQKLSELQVIETKLFEIDRRISSSSSISNFLRAPILARELGELDFKLEQLDIFFRIIGLLSSAINAQRSEMRQMVVSIASACLSISGDAAQQRQVLHDLQSIMHQRDSTNSLPKPKEALAEEYFAMGLAEFKPSSGGTVHCRVDPEKVQSAARFFRKSCDLGKKEAYRCLGDIFYDGYGVYRCFHTAANTYKEGVARGDAASKYRLGNLYEFGHGVPSCISVSGRLYREAADEGCAESMKTFGVWCLNGQHIQQDLGLAFRMLRKADLLDVGGARGELGIFYERGIGVERDPKKAFEFLSDSFDKGCMFRIAELSSLYDTGQGVEKNPVAATKLYEHCIQAGTWHGNFYKALYGLRLIKGQGIAKDEARGKAVIIDSTNSGSAIAWYALGECFRQGYGWKADKNQAIDFYQRALKCKSGLPGLVGSYEALGRMFESGDGVVACAERSSAYYLSAANLLSQLGQWKVACAFERGIGQTVDLQRAAYLYKMSANSGHKSAQRKALAFYMRGHGVERSRVHARRMMQDASRRGNMEAKRWLIREDIRDALVCLRRFNL